VREVAATLASVRPPRLLQQRHIELKDIVYFLSIITLACSRPTARVEAHRWS